MRLLRYVGPGSPGNPSDGAGAAHLVVEDAHRGERFGLLIDDPLRRALADLAGAGAQSASPQGAPRSSDHVLQPASAAPAAPKGPLIALSPREIQVRVRAGESPEQLAAEAGVSPERIIRFAYAVIQERLRVAAEARRGRARRGGPEGPVMAFGEIVDARFEEHGISPADVTWDAIRDGDGPWTVIARWNSANAQGSAQWSFSLGSRTLVPEDDTAMELLSDRPVQRQPGGSLTVVAPMPADAGAAHGEPANERAPRPDDQFFDQEAFDDAAQPPSAAVPFAGLRAVPSQHGEPRQSAEPAQPWDAVRSVQPAEGAGPSAEQAPAPPQLGAFFDSGAPHTEPTLPLDIGDLGRVSAQPPAPAPPVPPRPRVHQPPLMDAEDLIEAQELPDRSPRQEPPGPAGGRESEDDRAARSRIPSWDDILLGVRRKRD